MSGPSVQPVLLCACLAAGLLFDPMGFLRMTLVCAFVHESGHVLAYMLCTHKLPGLHFSAGGIGLSGAEQLPRTQELWVLAAGPLANFIMAALLFLQLHWQASYALYFLAAVSLCTGVYNLMPFGVLDGARLLQNLLPAEKQDALRRAQRLLLCLFCAALRCWAGCRAALVRRLSWGRVICWQRSSGKNKEERPAQRVNGTVHRPFLFAFCAQIRYNMPA